MACIYPSDDKVLGVEGSIDKEPLRWLLAERVYAWVTRSLNPNDMVLDYGCGSGYGTQIISTWLTDGFCIGVDKDETAIKYADSRCKTPRNEFACDNVLKEDKPLNELFSAIVMVDMLSETDDPVRLLELLLPSLRPNGRVIVAESPDKIERIERLVRNTDADGKRRDFLPIRGYFAFFLVPEKKGFRVKACLHDKIPENADKVIMVSHLMPRRDMKQNAKYQAFAKKYIGHPEGATLFLPDGNRFVVVATDITDSDVGNANVHSMLVRDFREEPWGRLFEEGFDPDKPPAYVPFREVWGVNFEANRKLVEVNPGLPSNVPQVKACYIVAPGRSLEKNSFELASVQRDLIIGLNGAIKKVPRGTRHKIALMVDHRSLESWIPDDPEMWDLWTSVTVNPIILKAPWKSINFLRLAGSNPAYEAVNKMHPESVKCDSCLSVALVGMHLALYTGCEAIVHVGMGDAWLVKDGTLKHHAKGTGYEAVHDVPVGAFEIQSRDGKRAYINKTYKQGTDAVVAENYFFLEPAQIKAAFWNHHAEECDKAKEVEEAAVARKRRDWWLKHPADEHIRVIDASQCDASILVDKYRNIPHKVEIMELSEAICDLEGKRAKRAQRKRRKKRRR